MSAHDDTLTLGPARTMEDLARVYTIRAATYMAEQDCPYDEEFDGNDFVGTQILASEDGNPVGCIRLRYFGDFVKLERLAVLPSCRGKTLARKIITYAIEFCQRKGFRNFCAHVPDHTLTLWQSFGFRPAAPNGTPKSAFSFSDYEYQECHLYTDYSGEQVTLNSKPLTLIRPEGEWDRPGILDASSLRGAKDQKREGQYETYRKSA
ncbi:GNAT family N-acetyltransferase [Parvularcula flava]|uniref:Acyltransferase n=1 Tax=Aquisalinus luteolus TaxID=1566827 RepID=A0A8J3A132_9PROT|nr:GNAT family N-acetyltransferase [Aquisalinus luteolus]NHK26382.1 GNAT family N-acetyltransferase [Aquisalinus luteolus]GGH92166.1 acyltransferase [Aquisalinus luteolus]